MRTRTLLRYALPVHIAVFASLLTYANIGFAQGDAKRGLYISKAAGCAGCHTEARKDAPPYAGGRALKTPFGTFYGPNITPHQAAGIGDWTEARFMKAMRQGERPDGSHYFPAFPYPSFSHMTDGDLKDLWTFLRTLPPHPRPNQQHDLRWPFGWRLLVAPWKWLYFNPASFTNDPKGTELVNRGAYLVQALGHCGECHTPRNFLGATTQGRFLAGAKNVAPNLTPTRLKKWTDDELTEFLATGLMPDGDVVGESMGEVIENTTSQLTRQDIKAIVAYLRSLPPQPDEK